MAQIGKDIETEMIGRDWDRSEWIESDRNELTQRIEKERKGFEQIGLV